MRKIRVLLISLLVIFVLAGVGLFIFNFFIPKASGLLVESSPASAVYVDGEEVGRTPYTSLRKSGEISLRLIPDSFGQPLAPYEEKINLVSGVETVIRRYYGTNEKSTEGETLSFEKLVGSDKSGIVILTDPENVQIEIDDMSKGTSPYTSSDIENGKVKIHLSASGYKDRNLEVNLIKGFKLIAFIKLASTDELPNKVSEPTKPETVTKNLVRILKTPTGFLRVRKEASVSAVEIGQVKPGEEYALLSNDESSDWYKIVVKEGVEGWVTKQYAELVTATASPSATVSP